MSSISRGGREWLFKTLALLLAVVSFAMISEICTRLYLGAEPGNKGKLFKNKQVKIGFAGNDGHESVFWESNRPIVKGLPATINNLGLRDARDRQYKKPARTMRVAMFGDSFTFGHGNRDAETLPAQLERFLNVRDSDQRYEVLNFGVQGFNTTQEYIYLTRFGMQFQPDAALFVWLYNDFHNRGYTVDDLESIASGHELVAKAGAVADFAAVKRGARFPLSVWLRDHSELYNYFIGPKLKYLYARLFGLDGVSGDAVYTNFDLPGARLSLLSLQYAADFCRRRGIKFGVVIYPALQALGIRYHQDKIYSRVKEFCRTQGIPAVNLFEATFAGRDASRLVVSRRDVHPNGRAQELAAQAVADWFTKVPSAEWKRFFIYGSRITSSGGNVFELEEKGE